MSRQANMSGIPPTLPNIPSNQNSTFSSSCKLLRWNVNTWEGVQINFARRATHSLPSMGSVLSLFHSQLSQINFRIQGFPNQKPSNQQGVDHSPSCHSLLPFPAAASNCLKMTPLPYGRLPPSEPILLHVDLQVLGNPPDSHNAVRYFSDSLKKGQ